MVGEEQARRLHGAGGEDEQRGCYPVDLFSFAVLDRVNTAVRSAMNAGDRATRLERQPASGQCLANEGDVGRPFVAERATAAAVSAIVAGRAAVIDCGQGGARIGLPGHAQFLAGVDQQAGRRTQRVGG